MRRVGFVLLALVVAVTLIACASARPPAPASGRARATPILMARADFVDSGLLPPPEPGEFPEASPEPEDGSLMPDVELPLDAMIGPQVSPAAPASQ